MAAARHAAGACAILSALVTAYQMPPLADVTEEGSAARGRAPRTPESEEAILISDRTWQVPADLSEVREAGREGGMSQDDTHRLLNAISEAAGMKGAFIVTVTDGGMLDMAKNMLSSLDAVPCQAHRLVIGLGANLCPTFQDLHGTTCVEVFQQDAGSEDEVAWGSHEYWQVVFRKHVVLTVVAMSKMSRHVIYTDPDIVFLSSPVSYLVRLSEDYDIIFSPNNMLDPKAGSVEEVAETYETRGMEKILIGPHQRHADINTGLFCMSSNSQVADLMLKTMRIFRDQEFVHGHYQQYSLVKALDEIPGIRIGVAAGDKLVNGNVFWGHRELLKPAEVISVHANWMQSNLKIPCLKEAGFWVVGKANVQRLAFDAPSEHAMVGMMDERHATVEACGEFAHQSSRTVSPSAMQEPPRPTKPGCYLWLPKGCPQHNFHAQDNWRRTEGSKDRQQCTIEAKDLYKNWCGTTDAQMLYIAPLANGPPEPTASGCYVWMPSGCEKHQFHAKDAWRQVSATDFPNQEVCTDKAPEKYNKWCDTQDAYTLWVPAQPEVPQQSGCYTWFPTGCKLHPMSTNNRWIRDVWGEQNLNTRTDKTACTQQRKNQIDAWCDITNTMMAFVD